VLQARQMEKKEHIARRQTWCRPQNRSSQGWGTSSCRTVKVWACKATALLIRCSSQL
jgi:hypothetical protein